MVQILLCKPMILDIIQQIQTKLKHALTEQCMVGHSL